MKKLFLTFTGLFFSLILTAQSASSKAVTTRVGILNGPSCIPVAKLIEDSTSVLDQGLRIINTFKMYCI